MEEMLRILSCVVVSSNDIKIVEYIYNEFVNNHSLVREIKSKTLMEVFELSSPKVNKFKNKLVECGFMKQIKRDTYMLNPSIYVPKLASKRLLKKKWSNI